MPFFLGDYTVIDGIALDIERSLLILDGELTVFDGLWLEESPIMEILPIPVERVMGHVDSLWLQGVGQRFLFQEGELRSIEPTSNNVRLFAYGSLGESALGVPELLLIDTTGVVPEVVD